MVGGLVLGKKKQVGSSHPLSHGELVRVCRYLVGVEFGGDDCDEVLEHLVICSKKEKLKGSPGTDNVVTVNAPARRSTLCSHMGKQP